MITNIQHCIFPFHSCKKKNIMTPFYFQYFVFLFIGNTCAIPQQENEALFLAVVDAGSSHTSFYIFQVMSSQELKQIEECYIDGGVDEFLFNLEQLDIYFSICLDVVYGVLPTDILRSTPLYVGATAGLRLLQISNPEGAESIMMYIRDFFSRTEFIFKDEHCWILTGKEEGVYSLISTNILEGGSGLSVGSLDMGGGSTQVAFKCFPEILLNPCLNSKLKWFSEFPTRKSDIFDSPCTILNPELSDFVSTLETLPDDFEFLHHSNFSNLEVCEDVINDFIDLETCSNIFASNCFQFSAALPASRFYAMSTYYWDFAVILNMHTQSIGLEEARLRIVDACNQISDENTDLNCFDLLYIFNILTRGYGFKKETFSSIDFVMDIRGFEVSWALGFAASVV
ncbi:ectonucleoside triphosphate diphosphohydrolase 1 isoform X2 [Eurytemora carolleeae]|uniref:ectonucleoside triphosphate diphosphohydrolase 1 isoform X2 n=1 Tax=Eurytemora carolleeae TaxID=1294199 RepID=UPI000C759DDD|nr:ectonucleoside triphosphate diphosphohydrolase 1 isoform X2 [Eurytemora carolleeae]|eukprot:XP_023334780.1 ectonucleoside triphosphate diphosphohydrolase 1-like isoform X2 [Eurytemora affinis]